MTIYKGQAVTFEKYGKDLQNLLHTTTYEIDSSKLEPNQLLLKTVASPINPADIGQIGGGYNDKEPITNLGNISQNDPTNVGGNEGVFKILAIGSNVSNFSIDDLVIPLLPKFGTWRNYAIAQEKDLIKVNGLTIEQAATISINPSTAYQILHQFVDNWEKGDYIVQNGGNSQVSKYITQLSKIYDINVISIIRDGKSQQEIENLKNLGAKEVIFESEFDNENFDITKYTSGANVRLALNGTSTSTSSLVKSLSPNGTLVTYGVIGNTEIKYDARLQLFKNLSTKAFWLTANTYKNPEFKKETIYKLIELYEQKKISDVGYEKLWVSDNDDITKSLLRGVVNTKSNGKQVLFYK
ncbi:ETR1 [Candida jiufengensis]|uniref:ETR1 n=1 Tax=Candida jiufengensis TaxID=497108 RepID=UPI0022253052|nr:ETR1 [Candida jiufengensis]KAI5951134.1 ETR1 [Candida jiufengensis]